MASDLLDLQKLIEAIHVAAPRVVINFAGAGAQVLTWLHGVAGSSRTVLEATDSYAANSLIDLIGFKPEQFTSLRVARAMASQAYVRACELAEPTTPVAGIGCTATIATDRTKRGDHRCCVALCDSGGVTTYSLTFSKGLRTRIEEETVVSLLILQVLAKCCHLDGVPRLPLTHPEQVREKFVPADLLSRLLAGEFKLVTAWPNGTFTPTRNNGHRVLFSGSFNPLHKGHRQLATAIATQLGRTVHFELPLVNADKASIKVEEAHRRLVQFRNFAPVFLTTAPLFDHKAQIFPHSIFIVGVDTAARLIQPRFYQHNQAKMLTSLEKIRVAGCRFLVAGRVRGDSFLTLSHLSLPDGYRELFEEIPETDFRLDISSTDLRNNLAGN